MPSRRIRLAKALRLRQKKWDAECAAWLREPNNRGKKRADYARAKGDRPNTTGGGHAKPGTGR